MYRNHIKRILDIILSTIALIVFGIPMLIVAYKVKKDVGSPVLFTQKRIGKGNKEFNMYKFRSMTNARDEKGIFLPDSERITKFGHFIRKNSIDELPELLNIIKGDMSIIGPRPLPVRYLERYTEEQKRRHEIRPGLSSPSVVHGRNMQTWEKQFKEDIWYVDHVNFLTDMKSLLGTIKIVITHEGAMAADGGCRGEFIGIADIDKLKTDNEGSYMKF